MPSRFLKAIGWPWWGRKAPEPRISLAEAQHHANAFYSRAVEAAYRLNRLEYIEKTMFALRQDRDKAIKHKKRHSHYQEQLEALMVERLRLEQGK